MPWDEYGNRKPSALYKKGSGFKMKGFSAFTKDESGSAPVKRDWEKNFDIKAYKKKYPHRTWENDPKLNVLHKKKIAKQDWEAMQRKKDRDWAAIKAEDKKSRFTGTK